MNTSVPTPERDPHRAANPRNGWCDARCGGRVKDESFTQRLVAQAVERFDGLDIASNNAVTHGESGLTPGISASGW